MPFPPALEVSPDVIAAVAEAHLPIAVTLAHLEDRPGALVIRAYPDDDLRALTSGITALRSDWPPHRNGRNFAYHVTLVRTRDADIRRAAAEATRPHLPHTEVAHEVWRFDGNDEHLNVQWRHRVSV